jgi:glyoxylase-like metal-dependent hydrolase (beta-lactamase superfamily II)
VRLSFHNSATVRGPSRLVSKTGTWGACNFPVRYGVFEHATHGLMLIDTGYSQSLYDSGDPPVILYRNLLRPRIVAAGDATAVVEAAGATRNDVRHIILTHLHADHMCGLQRFPKARIHASAVSLNGWRNPSGFSSTHKGCFPSLLPAFTECDVHATDSAPEKLLPWGGTGHDVLGDNSIIAVDLPGHMKGHIGLLFPSLPQPLFHAADADWTLESLLQGHAATLPARMIVDDVTAMARSKSIVRRAHDHGFAITLCHDDSP